MSAIWPGALLVVYLAVTGLLVLAGWSRVSVAGAVAHFAVLIAVAATTWTRAVPRWLRYWAPLLVLLFLYAEMPVLIRAAGHRDLFDAAVVRWEAAVFGGQPALEWASRWPSMALSETLHLAYLGYYPMIFAVPAALYVGSRHSAFSEAVFVLMLTFTTCFVWYLAFPVAGPRYAGPESPAVLRGPVRSFVLWLLDAGSSRGTAFPSSHVAVSVAQSVLAVRYLGWRAGAAAGGLTVGLGLGAVYGGFHYAIDVAAGALVGIATTMLGLGLARALSRGVPIQAKASAPT